MPKRQRHGALHSMWTVAAPFWCSSLATGTVVDFDAIWPADEVSAFASRLRAGFRLPRDHSVGFPDGAAFVAGSFHGRTKDGDVSMLVASGAINAGVSSRAAAITCAASGTQGDGAAVEGPGTFSGGSGQPVYTGVSTMVDEAMAAGPPSRGAGDEGAAGSMS